MSEKNANTIILLWHFKKKFSSFYPCDLTFQKVSRVGVVWISFAHFCCASSLPWSDAMSVSMGISSYSFVIGAIFWSLLFKHFVCEAILCCTFEAFFVPLNTDDVMSAGHLHIEVQLEGKQWKCARESSIFAYGGKSYGWETNGSKLWFLWR